MAKVIEDHFMACDDCTPVLANGDYTHLDYHYSDPAECDAVIKAINEGMEAAKGDIALGDSERDDEFSRSRCDCCGTRLAGSRTHCVVLSWG